MSAGYPCSMVEAGAGREEHSPRTRLTVYGSTIGLAILGALAAGTLKPGFVVHQNYSILFYPAILLVAFEGGLAPGLVSLALCALAGVYFRSSNSTPAIEQTSDLAALSLFCGVGIIVILLANRQRLAKERAEANALDAEKKAETLCQSHAESEQLNARLRDTLTEMNHRIKNNLQILGAMLDMQMLDYEDTLPRREAQRLALQIKTVATIHDMLTQDARKDGLCTALPFRPLLIRLLDMLQTATYHDRFTCNIANVVLTVKQATALALVTNELVSNAVKHGRGWVQVTLQEREAAIVLEVEDNGPGFPSGFDTRLFANTGLMLVNNIVGHDLKGMVTFENRTEGGARVRITVFPVVPSSKEHVKPLIPGLVGPGEQPREKVPTANGE
jgi:two-component system, sensor histidine kinase PdtaS